MYMKTSLVCKYEKKSSHFIGENYHKCRIRTNTHHQTNTRSINHPCLCNPVKGKKKRNLIMRQIPRILNARRYLLNTFCHRQRCNMLKIFNNHCKQWRCVRDDVSISRLFHRHVDLFTWIFIRSQIVYRSVVRESDFIALRRERDRARPRVLVASVRLGYKDV